MNKRIIRIIALIICLSLAGGCTQPGEYPGELPMPSLEPPSIAGQEPREITAELFFCSADGKNLEPETRTISIPYGESTAHAVIAELAKGPSSGLSLIPVIPDTLVFESAEMTGDICNIYFSGTIKENAFLALRAALASTIFQAQGIGYIDVFIDGAQPGYKGRPLGPISPIVSTLEAYMMNTYQEYQRPSEAAADTAVEQALETREAALYYSDAAGGLLLCDVRAVAYDTNADRVQIASALLIELMKGPLTSEGRERLLPSDMRLQRVEIGGLSQGETPETEDKQEAELDEQANDTPVIIDLYFNRPRTFDNESLACASLVYTLTGFIPDAAGVRVFLGGELVRGAQEAPAADGVLSRSDFSNKLGYLVRLCFPDKNGQGLYSVRRSISQDTVYEPMVRLAELFTGEGDPGVRLGTFTPEDILSVTRQGQMVVVNFAPGFFDKLSAFIKTSGASILPDHTRARMFVFSIVNTLCSMPNTSCVWMLEDGKIIDETVDMIYLGGSIFENPGLVLP